MPKVLFLDTKPHIYDVLKRKFEREGFEVLAEGQDQDVDLIVKGKSSVGGAIGHGDARSHIPMIILSEDHIADKENMNGRPSGLGLSIPKSII